MTIKFKGIEFDNVKDLVEYQKLIGAVIQTEPQHTEIAQPKHTQTTKKTTVKYYRKAFSYDELDNIIELKKRGFTQKQIAKKTGRTSDSIYILLHRLETKQDLSSNLKNYLKLRSNVSDIIKSKKVDNRVIRGKLMFKKIKYLQQQNPRLPFNKAWKIAQQEMSGKSLGTIKSELEVKSPIPQPQPQQDFTFPQMSMLTETANRVFEQMLVDIIGRHGKISFHNVIGVLHLRNEQEWDTQIWKSFVSEFLNNKDKICKVLIGCNPKRLIVKEEAGLFIIKYK